MSKMVKIVKIVMNCNWSQNSNLSKIKNHKYMKHLDMLGGFKICDFSEARLSLLLLLLVKPLPAPSLALVASSGGPASGQAATTPHSSSHLPRAANCKPTCHERTWTGLPWNGSERVISGRTIGEEKPWIGLKGAERPQRGSWEG